MNKLTTALTQTFYKAKFSFQKNSPEILLIGGITGVVASGVLACRATLKAPAILEEHRDQMATIKTAHEEIPDEAYSEKDYKRDLTIRYVQTGLKMAKLYAPAVILGALSITGICESNKILKERNLALAAAYATVDRTFGDYRRRVAERFGDDVEKELKHNIKAESREETIEDENGKKRKIKVSENVMQDQPSGYSRWFDENNRYWTRDAQTNLRFLKNTEAHCNDLLKLKGYLTLNEVYSQLGLPTCREGCVIGWIYDPKNCDHEGDNYIDFGLYNVKRKSVANFINGLEKCVLLDFNPDGNILETKPSDWDRVANPFVC